MPKDDSRFGPWQADGSLHAGSPSVPTTPQEPNKEIVEFFADLDKTCRSARRSPAAGDLTSGTLAPASVIGRVSTSQDVSCSIKRDERSVSDLVSGGRTQSLRDLGAGFQTHDPQEVRALLCVDESAEKVGTYVPEKDPTGLTKTQAYQLVWDVRLLSWPSRRVMARREFRGEVPPPRILMGGDVCGERPATALNQWLESGGEKRPADCDTRTSHKYPGFALAISPDGKLLASASGDGAIKLWSLPDGILHKRLPTPRREAMGVRISLAISPDGKLLASSMSDHQIQLWALPEGALVSSFPVGERGSIHTLAFGADNTYLASGEDGFGGVKLWSIPHGTLLKAIPTVPSESPNLAMAMSGNGKLLASGGYDRTVTVRDLPKGAAKFLRGHQNWVGVLAVSADGKFAASGNKYDGVKLWSISDGTEITTLSASDVRALAFHPDGATLVSGGAILKIWTTEGKPIKSLWGHGQGQQGTRSGVDAVAISPDGKLLASGGNTSIRLWSLPEGHLEACLADPE